MKKTVKAFWLALIGVAWLFLMATSCHKTPTPTPPEPDLPPATQTGKNIFGCYINGTPWVSKPYVAIGIPHALEVVFDESRDNFFAVQSIKDGTLNERISIFSNNTKLGVNTIIPDNTTSFSNLAGKNNCELYYLDTTKTRVLNITKLDKMNGVISGTFEFTAVNKCKDTLKFTQGRFDTKF